ncbi:MAG TPA: hypothetical protein VMV86_02135, partial [Methanosarcinales archaeon]|nr:hypothetical protein [Methanosarcinales archaeon]
GESQSGQILASKDISLLQGETYTKRVDASAENEMVDNTSETSNKNSQPNPLFNTTLTLPNGQRVTPDHAVRWKDLLVSLQIQSLPSPNPQQYLEILGNHSNALSHSIVSTSAGTATFVLNERTPPAAAHSTSATYEYWVIVYGSHYAYILEATVIGNNLDNAKTEVMELLGNWKIP